MILLDTHIWIWWIDQNQRLTNHQREILQNHESTGLGVNVISCWEVAKLVEYGRLQLICPIEEWMSSALAYPGIQLIELTPQIAIESTKLPGNFHRDPADQIIVATARIFDIPLMTVDGKILNYLHVRTLT